MDNVIADGSVNVKGSELNEMHVLVGTYGGRSAVENVEPSSSLPGKLLVETEHGPLYLDPDEEYAVLVSV